MKKNLIENSEKNRILNMHQLVKEQTQKVAQVNNVDKLKTALQSCIKNYTWFTPDADAPIRRTKNGTDIIFGTGSNGNTYYFYPDLTVVNATTGVKKNWECKAWEPVVEDPTKPKPLNNNQMKVLEIIKPSGYFNEPAPTEVEVDLGKFQKIDLTGTQNPKDLQDDLGLVQKYSKFFPAVSFPNGFYVYKEVKTLPSSDVTKKNKVEVTAQSCKTAIENLWNFVDSPRNYPLNAQEIADNREIVETCAEPANKEKFVFRFGLKDKLQDLVNSRLRIKSKI